MVHLGRRRAGASCCGKDELVGKKEIGKTRRNEAQHIGDNRIDAPETRQDPGRQRVAGERDQSGREIEAQQLRADWPAASDAAICPGPSPMQGKVLENSSLDRQARRPEVMHSKDVNEEAQQAEVHHHADGAHGVERHPASDRRLVS